MQMYIDTYTLFKHGRNSVKIEIKKKKKINYIFAGWKYEEVC